jgi:nitroreductase
MLDQDLKVNEANWTAVADTIRNRRSNLNVDLERPVRREMVEELVHLAVLAPNHYRTNPWRFVVVSGPARERLGDLVAREVAKQPDVKDSYIERQRGQFLRAPTVLIIASAGNEDPIKQFENKYAVAAGIQNILIGASAAGLASAWKSGPAMTDPAVSAVVKEDLGLDPADEIVGVVYLGYSIGAPSSRSKLEPRISYLNE